MKMMNQQKVETLNIWLKQVRRRLAMLEAAAPFQARDAEQRRRIKEAEIEESVILERIDHLNSEDESWNLNRSDVSTNCGLSA